MDSTKWDLAREGSDEGVVAVLFTAYIARTMSARLTRDYERGGALMVHAVTSSLWQLESSVIQGHNTR